ncbi:MAG: FmdE family protein [Ardenticatenaceae bacterium]|nr:FmdE family protein [Ardenticatenaceae bacterium]HBY92437.1 formylmethanofuran dehydrogenase [Chloroflexota bacterium]
MKTLDELLRASAALHPHLCPRQVLGVRMGLLAGEVLELDVPRHDKRLLAVVETDGCAADGVAVATGCWVGRRTLRIEDYGKVAATVVDTRTGRTVRVVPRPSVRERARVYAPEAETKWQAQLLGYQRMPTAELLLAQEVVLASALEEPLSKVGSRVICQLCGEEILNEREVVRDGLTLCRACAGKRYYQVLEESVPLPVGALLFEG